ncbi:MAG: beta-hydroxyacyl-ACP dehydratase [Bacteriovoracaceae bacterium]|nr:beta-hydroxyacyl-ACP dehydratase [Bacteriovoracaceae bacterium]
MKYSNEEVKQFIPHREPFLFVDSVESVIHPEIAEGKLALSAKELVGVKVITNYRTKKEHPIFEGHFPENPIFPGVCQVEMMAQACCFGVTKMLERPLEANLEVALMGVDSAKFRKPVLPETDLRVEAVCIKVRGPVMSYEAKLFAGDELKSQCTILASVRIK